MSNKPTIAFVTGGYSGEAVISYKSAITIQNNVDTSRFNVYRIDITPESWFHPGADGKKHLVNRNDFSLDIDGQNVKFDAVLIGIHGTLVKMGNYRAISIWLVYLIHHVMQQLQL
jgi:D-alanine-D-alanine ligase